MTKSTLIDQLPNNVASKIQNSTPKLIEVVVADKPSTHIPPPPQTQGTIDDVDINLEDVIQKHNEENGSHLDILQQQIEELREELTKSQKPVTANQKFLTEIPTNNESIITQVYKNFVTFLKDINYKGLLLVFITALLVYSTKVDSFMVKRLGETAYIGYTHYFKSAILSILVYLSLLI